MKYLVWALLWLPLLLIGIFARIVSPIICLFITRQSITDTVKRLNRQVVTLERDKLVWWLTWFDTDDNATDEYWYGVYNWTSKFTQEQYDNSAILRYICRVCWLNRNAAYTFKRKVFGISKDSWLNWQFKKDIPLFFGYYNSVNIGWKAHKGIDKLLYAGRILGIKKHE